MKNIRYQLASLLLFATFALGSTLSAGAQGSLTLCQSGPSSNVLASSGLIIPASSRPVDSEFVNQGDVDAMDQALLGLNAFTSVLGDYSSTEQDVIDQGYKTNKSFEGLLSRSFSITELGDDYRKNGESLKISAENLKKVISKAACLNGASSSTIFALDDDAYEGLVDEYNARVDDLNLAMENLNESVDEGNTAIINDHRNTSYLVMAPFVLSLGLMFYLFRWSRTSQIMGDPVDPLAPARKNMFKQSILPTAGLGVTAISYYFADKLGGNFVFSWGFIIFGVVGFAKSVMEYKSAKKLAEEAIATVNSPARPVGTDSTK